MNDNELRVGNLVTKNFPKEDYGKWFVADFITINCPQNYDPIPLTPEILDKVNWDGYVKFHINSYFSIDDVGHLYYHNDYTGINMNHLHQFQNLYFALTGKELILHD